MNPKHGGGLAQWSVAHPVGVTMIALAIIVLGLFSLGKLAIDLLPHLIYPEIRVRILDPGVSATVMEDRVTRQLEEQLAITEDAISVQSNTTLGLTTVDLSFSYGKDIDIALRDASTRLDRAKRFLPDTINPPMIYKLDPSQIPVQEFVISSNLRNPVELRSWVDDVLRKWFLNLPGVAAAEVGGGLIREIHILPDQQRLAGVGLSMKELIDALERGNREDPTGRLLMQHQELSGRISGRFNKVEHIQKLPLRTAGGKTIYLGEVAQVKDTHGDERLRVRSNTIPGVKLSIQKQPNANTIAVVDVVSRRLAWLQQQQLFPEDITITSVADQSIYVRQALSNSSLAAVSGALLAMTVVYFFLGNLRRTLIIGSAIPIAIMVTFIIMGAGGLTLNIMTLGGLALGVGMLVDNTIVMLENIYRHQCQGETATVAGTRAAAEVNSAIVASTSTNLAAVLPFLFIGGLTGLLFRELIFTISAAIAASMVIALTLVPTLAARVPVDAKSRFRTQVDTAVMWMQSHYTKLVRRSLELPWLAPVIFTSAIIFAAPVFFSNKQVFLPKMDDGRITLRIQADPGISLDEMDNSASKIEKLLLEQKETQTVFTLAGGAIFGRTQRETPSQTTIIAQLVPLAERDKSSGEWIKHMQKQISALQLAGIKVRMTQRGVRGIRTGRGDDDISLRIQGPELEVLEEIAANLVGQLKPIAGMQNLSYSSEEEQLEISIEPDRERANILGLNVQDISQALQIALEGIKVTEYVEGDRSYNVILRLPRRDMANPQDLESIMLSPAVAGQPAIYLGNVAEVKLVKSPASIKRDNQLRIVEISGSIADDATLGGVLEKIEAILNSFELPQGYTLYEGGAKQALQEGKQLTYILLSLALFLVFVVMAVQYESLRNPIVIIISVPFAYIGVAVGLMLTGASLSMPVWLGMIMLAGIVVNNAIVLVEYIEIVRQNSSNKHEAIIEAAALRLRPILMTTLTTVVGMLPLALGLGEGAEMLQPLAVCIVFGLSFSMLVSLLLVPTLYALFHPEDQLAVKHA
ncbi:MAG: efflux RND transporter permease subunit [Gammaproteobacteria bacterium]|nr:efflux RND transporter permease subunit [Gammaproteobacteria bacterium]MDH5802534.1 efflux RND transporter permease subunit [Gammaproteobacteria bacterium]